MWNPANLENTTPEERRRAVAAVLARGILRLDCQLATPQNKPDVLNLVTQALQSRPPDPFMSTAVNKSKRPS